MAAITICSDFGAQKNKVSYCFHCFPIYFPWSDGTGCMILIFLMLSFKPTFSLSSFIFIKRLFGSSSLSAIRVVSSAYLHNWGVERLNIFSPPCSKGQRGWYSKAVMSRMIQILANQRQDCDLRTDATCKQRWHGSTGPTGWASLQVGVQTWAGHLQGPHSCHSPVTTLCSGKMLHQQWAKVRCYDPNAPLRGVGVVLFFFCFLPLLLAFITPKAWSCSCGTIPKWSSGFCSIVLFLSPCQDPGFTNLLPVFPQTNNPLLYMSIHPTVLLLPFCPMPYDGFPKGTENLWFSRGGLGWS